MSRDDLGAGFEKNRHGIYVWCSESFSEAAGMDSPQDVVGKHDDDLTWGKGGNQCDFSDREAQRKGHIIVTEVVRASYGWDVFKVSKNSNYKGGVIGHLVSIQGMDAQAINRFEKDRKVYSHTLQRDLILDELIVIYGWLSHEGQDMTSIKLGVVKRTVRNKLDKLKKEFSANNSNEFYVALVRTGIISTIQMLGANGFLDSALGKIDSTLGKN